MAINVESYRRTSRAMSLGNPLLTDDHKRYLSPTSADRKNLSESIDRSNSSSTVTINERRGSRIGSLPNTSHRSSVEQSEENIRRFTSTIYGGIKNIGDSRRRSYRKSSLISTSNTDEASKIEMEIIELDNGTVKELIVFHIVIVGCHGVGKRSILRQFASSEYRGIYSFNYNAAQEDPNIIPVMIDDEEIRLQFFVVDIIDVKTPIPDADAYIVVYDISDQNSFTFACNIIKSLKDLPIILVGNKVDLVRKRTVSRKDGLLLSRNNLIKFIETSAALNDKIDHLLAGCIRQIQQDRQVNGSQNETDNISGCLQCIFPLKKKFDPEKLF